MTVDCMTCLVAASRALYGYRGSDIILEGITHSTYLNLYDGEHLTCRPNRLLSRITFRKRWLDAVTRAMRGMAPRAP